MKGTEMTKYALFVLLIPAFAWAQPTPCAGKLGKEIVECVEAAYPDRLVTGVSVETRQANMMFVRDRVIETARCAGLDVGLNLKRGGPSISFDFLAWRRDGRTEGVDIGSAYDDTNRPLNLQWHTYGPPDYGFPTYKAYGPVNCLIGPLPPLPPPVTQPLTVDVTPLWNTITALQGDTAHLRALVAQLETALANESTDRMGADDAMRAQVQELASKPLPTVCAARGPFGIPIRCELR